MELQLLVKELFKVSMSHYSHIIERGREGEGYYEVLYTCTLNINCYYPAPSVVCECVFILCV